MIDSILFSLIILNIQFFLEFCIKIENKSYLWRNKGSFFIESIEVNVSKNHYSQLKQYYIIIYQFEKLDRLSKISFFLKNDFYYL